MHFYIYHARASAEVKAKQVGPAALMLAANSNTVVHLTNIEL